MENVGTQPSTVISTEGRSGHKAVRGLDTRLKLLIFHMQRRWISWGEIQYQPSGCCVIHGLGSTLELKQSNVLQHQFYKCICSDLKALCLFPHAKLAKKISRRHKHLWEEGNNAASQRTLPQEAYEQMGLPGIYK